jgi:hypothetical protein
MTSRIAICVTAILAVVFLAATAHCQDSTGNVKGDGPIPSSIKTPPGKPTVDSGIPLPPPPLLSADDKFHGRSLQLEEAQDISALQQTPQYQTAMAAQQRRAQFFRDLYAKYHLDAAHYVVCDGPGTGQPSEAACKGVARGDMEWRAVVAPAPAPAATGPKR